MACSANGEYFFNKAEAFVNTLAITTAGHLERLGYNAALPIVRPVDWGIGDLQGGLDLLMPMTFIMLFSAVATMILIEFLYGASEKPSHRVKQGAETLAILAIIFIGGLITRYFLKLAFFLPDNLLVLGLMAVVMVAIQRYAETLYFKPRLCSGCGTANERDSLYCKRCGSIFCSRCGTANERDSLYCKRCGIILAVNEESNKSGDEQIHSERS